MRWCLIVFGMLSSITLAQAQDPAATTEAAVAAKPEVMLEPHEQAFVDLMTDAVMVGTFTIDGRGGTPKEERYEIKSVSKVNGDSWTVNARIVYGKLDVVVPVPVKMKWAGDTPVLQVTDLNIPLVGNEFTSRVMFYDNRYAGTWAHGKVGGHMWGVIEHQQEGETSESDESE